MFSTNVTLSCKRLADQAKPGGAEILFEEYSTLQTVSVNLMFNLHSDGIYIVLHF